MTASSSRSQQQIQWGRSHAYHKDAVRVGSLLRVEDPTDRLITVEEKPSRIDWINLTLSSDAFKKFVDWNTVLDQLRKPTGNWISLFEETEQRILDRHGSGRPARSTKVFTSLFYAPSGQKDMDRDKLSNLQPGWMALYRFELRNLKSLPNRSDKLERKGAFAQVSMRSFRGRLGSSIAALRPDLIEEWNLLQENEDYFGYRIDDRSAVRSTEWQEAFDQERRRHEPISSGFLLEIERKLLSDWAVRNGLSLWLKVHIQRTVDQYSPESEMEWVERVEQVEITL